MFNVETKGLTRRAIQVGDKATLWEYVDWMMSPSSNSAAGMVMREAMLLRQYGTAYPVPEAEIKRFFTQTPKSELTALYEKTFFEPVTRNGLDLEQLRQGSFFTATGKQIVPGPGDSAGTARELMRYLLRMEEGRLVDEWSSREIKRLMYVTERRIRYASAPSLADAAVYFKSGSLYECTKEAGFVCGQYMGNVKNYMNSIAIIEYPAGDRKLALHGDADLERAAQELRGRAPGTGESPAAVDRRDNTSSAVGALSGPPQEEGAGALLQHLQCPRVAPAAKVARQRFGKQGIRRLTSANSVIDE